MLPGGSSREERRARPTLLRTPPNGTVHTDPGPTAREPAGGAGIGSASVLVVGDAGRAPGLRRALESEGGFRVTTAADLGDAIEGLGAGGFDAVLLDVDLPGIRPAEAVGRVRKAAPDAALVVIGDESGVLRRCVGKGADEWVVRGDSADALVRCVAGAVQRRRLRAERDASEARFRNIIQRTADGIVIVGQDGWVRFVNPAAERLFGRSAAELAGQEFGVAALVGETTEIDIVRRGEPEPLVAELRASDTTWEGEAAQVISLRDITDRRRAEERSQRLLLEQAAREEAERAARRSRFLAEAGAALDASLDAAATLASLVRLVVPRLGDWCVVDLLEGAHVRRVAGAHADPERQALIDALGGGASVKLDSPHPVARVLRSGAAELHTGLDAGRVREVAADEADARRMLELGIRSCMIVPLPAREHPLGAITFVCGEREFTQADLALAEEVASRAGRALENARLYAAALAGNRAKADFLTVMSHELRTPLNAILGYTQILLDGGASDAQAAHLRRIRSGARHLHQMIEEILAYAEMEAGHDVAHPVRVRLGDLVDEVAATAEPLAREKGLALSAEALQPDAALLTDAGKLQRILLNLLTNAVKFTDAGTIRLSAEVRGDEVVVAVTDTGSGIAPENMETIFEPFWQAEKPLTRRAGGTGLGLSVSRRLAKMLGGAISVVSEPGAGSTFEVRIPVRLPTR
jgi:signal transduction histidine kinase/PAS domain-containing protein